MEIGRQGKRPPLCDCGNAPGQCSHPHAHTPLPCPWGGDAPEAHRVLSCRSRVRVRCSLTGPGHTYPCSADSWAGSSFAGVSEPFHRLQCSVYTDQMCAVGGPQSEPTRGSVSQIKKLTWPAPLPAPATGELCWWLNLLAGVTRHLLLGLAPPRPGYRVTRPQHCGRSRTLTAVSSPQPDWPLAVSLLVHGTQGSATQDLRAALPGASLDGTQEVRAQLCDAATLFSQSAMPGHCSVPGGEQPGWEVTGRGWGHGGLLSFSTGAGKGR